MNNPLADRVRPREFEDFLAQEDLIGENGVITKFIKSGFIPSIIFWGPPGVGKTTLANIIAKKSKREIYTLNAINSGVKEIREIISSAQNKGMFGDGKAPILFIDEIHRFSKSQQDSLLNAVEKGIVTLIGATTENPGFEVISALLSRCQVFVLKPLDDKNLQILLEKVIIEDVFLSKKNIVLKEIDEILRISFGDARKLLNTLEIVVNSSENEQIIVTNKLVNSVVKNSISKYDKTGENHYDVISAMIKSIRGSDPNAAVFWLAKMINGGEDLKFIARRLVISASEDIGMANPTALILANNCFQSVINIGYPESRIILSQCVIYLATSPKSNSSYMAINFAQKLAMENDFPVPLHLRNASNSLNKKLGYGKDYKYSHDFENNFEHQEYLPEKIKNKVIYKPQDNSRENKILQVLKQKWDNKYEF